MNHWREASSLIIASKSNFFKTGSSKLRCGSVNDTPKDTYFKHIENVKCNDDFKILLLRRSRKNSVMPGAYVFPGGTADPSDSSEEWLNVFNDFGYNVGSLKSEVKSGKAPIFEENPNSKLLKGIALRITAIRETFEESGVLLCRNKHINKNKSVNWASYVMGCKVQEWQDKIQNNPIQFLNLCKNLECVPDIWALHQWSNWLTPVQYPKRFDTAFFIAFLNQMPPAFIDNSEIDDIKWSTPSNIIEPAAEVWLPPPQFYEVLRLNAFKTIEDLSTFAIERASFGCERWMPVQVVTADGIVFFLPGDDMYPSNPNLFGSTKMNKLEETMLDLRKKSRRLHRMEFPGKTKTIIVSNIEPNYGHVLPSSES